MGRDVFVGGQRRPNRKGARSYRTATQFWGFLSVYAYTFLRRTTKFDVVIYMEKGLF